MFTDRSPPFRPRRPSLGLLHSAVIVIALGLGLYFVSERMRIANVMPAREALATTVIAPLEERFPRATTPAPVRLPVVEPSPVQDAPYRPRSLPRLQYVAPPVATPVARPATVTIYLCKGYSGGSFWTSGTCSSQGGSIDRMTTVPASLPFQEQVAMARQAADEAAKLYVAPQQNSVTVSAVGSSECPWLAQRIRDLDAQARQPLSAQSQDRIRRERMGVMSRRAALRC